MNLENTYMKPCPFCGSDVGSYKDSGDFIYPANKAKTAFSLNCLIVYGGCGAEMLGSSPEECIAKWNTRYDDFDFDEYMGYEGENHDDND